jgi:hypothetical protein
VLPISLLPYGSHQALGVLARRHKPLLAQYSSYLANVLDHLDAFTDSQLGQVFSMFAALTAKQPGQQAAAGEGTSSVGEQIQTALLPFFFKIVCVGTNINEHISDARSVLSR